jgi:PiT family inorganic phosphate transporter
LPPNEIVLLKEQSNVMKPYVEYAPKWVILMISLALGIGTMIGWKRIVVTIGSKIGKDHLTYAQGASSELIAASTIGISTLFKLPVSTTHILSSGVAGTMVADKGLKNLQKKTLKNIALAWVLTLPVCVALSFGLFYFLKMLFA